MSRILFARAIIRWRAARPCDGRICAGLDFIGITAISSVRRLTDAAFINAETAIEPRYEVEQIPSAAALVEAGLGVTALPSLTFSMFKGRNLAVRPLVEPRLRRNVGFVTLKGRTLPAQLDKLMRFIRASLLAGASPVIQPTLFAGIGTIASSLELRKVSDVFTLRTCGAPVSSPTKAWKVFRSGATHLRMKSISPESIQHSRTSGCLRT